MKNNMNNVDWDELVVMREEMHALKAALATQKIINEKLVRNALKDCNAKGRRLLVGNVLGLIIVVICCYILNADGVIGVPLVVGTILIMLVGLVVNTVVNWMSADACMTLPLTQLQEKLVRRRRQRVRVRWAGMAVAFVWLVFYGWELYGITRDYSLLVACIIGFLAGTSIGWLYFRKLQRADRDMINQIRNISIE